MQHLIQLNDYQANIIETAARVLSINSDEALKQAIDDEIERIEDVLVKSGHIVWND